ncbi:hypothetical protein Mpet_2346 [Methanolacinia petrolearia DSM 11571]|uniref:Uncharacterized protein n=1 Tax=Methanolacinia petrolearia (strain DSM 11571 / OCM 486 / SEBR 4847) TaxID=679926 RepID=E1RDB0_METP4|nr:hypothetical protein Mpet_2346 [Methanolacinia petrolearia DSM 11571]
MALEEAVCPADAAGDSEVVVAADLQPAEEVSGAAAGSKKMRRY